jgi:hypothetical protein
VAYTVQVDKMQQVDSLEWAVGLYEGEGSVSLQRGTYGAIMRVGMTDKDIVERFARFAGCGRVCVVTYRAKPHYKPIYTWQAFRASDIRRLLTMMLPLLGERRSAKAREVLEVLGPEGMCRFKRHVLAEVGSIQNGKHVTCSACRMESIDRRKFSLASASIDRSNR